MTFLTETETEALCAPASPIYLPFGWAVAGLAESAKHIMTAFRIGHSLYFLSANLSLLAIKGK